MSTSCYQRLNSVKSGTISEWAQLVLAEEQVLTDMCVILGYMAYFDDQTLTKLTTWWKWKCLQLSEFCFIMTRSMEMTTSTFRKHNSVSSYIVSYRKLIFVKSTKKNMVLSRSGRRTTLNIYRFFFFSASH